MKTIVMTKELLEKGRSRQGGFNGPQINCLGINLFKNRGWPRRIIGQEFPEEKIKKFLALKDAHLPPVLTVNLFTDIEG
jgi:hypothetical protein